MKRVVGMGFATIAAASLSGCMMAGGMAGMPDMHGVGPTPDSRVTTAGEVRTEALHVTLEVQGTPPGGDARILVLVRDAVTSDPISDATVRVVVASTADAMSTVLPVTQTAPGVHEATYRPGTPGTFTVTAEIVADEGRAGAAASVAIRQEVPSATRMSGRRSPLLAAGLLGSVVMAAMMIAMLGR
jgi:hypothetical protein